ACCAAVREGNGHRLYAVEVEPGGHASFDGGGMTMLKVLREAELVAALRERILAFLSRERRPELAGVDLVRGRADLNARMPAFAAKFFDHIWSSADQTSAAGDR